MHANPSTGVIGFSHAFVKHSSRRSLAIVCVQAARQNAFYNTKLSYPRGGIDESFRRLSRFVLLKMSRSPPLTYDLKATGSAPQRAVRWALRIIDLHLHRRDGIAGVFQVLRAARLDGACRAPADDRRPRWREKLAPVLAGQSRRCAVTTTQLMRGPQPADGSISRRRARARRAVRLLPKAPS